MDFMNNSESISVRNLPEAQPAWSVMRSDCHVRLKETYVCKEDIESPLFLEGLLADVLDSLFVGSVRLLRSDLDIRVRLLDSCLQLLEMGRIVVGEIEVASSWRET